MYPSDFFEGRIWFGMICKLVYCLQVARVHLLTNEDIIPVLTQSTPSLLGLSRIPRDSAKGILKRDNLFLWGEDRLKLRRVKSYFLNDEFDNFLH